MTQHQNPQLDQAYGLAVRGETEDALKLIARINSESEEAKYLELFAFAMRKKSFQAEQAAILDLARQRPDVTFARLAVHLFASKWGNYTKALEALEPCVAPDWQHPRKAIFHFFYAVACLKSGGPDLCRMHLIKALAPGPDRVEIEGTIQADPSLRSIAAHSLDQSNS